MTDHPTEQDVDISQTRAIPHRNDPDTVKLGSGHLELPVDLPGIMKVKRHLAMQGDPPRNGLVGWSVFLDIYNRADVQVKIALHGGLEVWVDGEKVASKPLRKVKQADVEGSERGVVGN